MNIIGQFDNHLRSRPIIVARNVIDRNITIVVPIDDQHSVVISDFRSALIELAQPIANKITSEYTSNYVSWFHRFIRTINRSANHSRAWETLIETTAVIDRDNNVSQPTESQLCNALDIIVETALTNRRFDILFVHRATRSNDIGLSSIRDVIDGSYDWEHQCDQLYR